MCRGSRPGSFADDPLEHPQLLQKAFSRFHAARQGGKDMRIPWVGCMLYGVLALHFYAVGPPTGAAPLFMALAVSVWFPPVFWHLGPAGRLIYTRWRNQMFAVQ